MAAEGRTVIFISHKLHEVKAVSDRVTVLRAGKTVATVDDRRLDAALARRADGRPRGRRARAARADGRARRAGARGRRRCRRRRPRRRGLRGVSLTVAPARSSAIAGVAGNGQRELAETVTGMRPRVAPARSSSAGKPLRGGDAREAIRAGVAHVPEDRLHTGVAPSLLRSRRTSCSRRIAARTRRRGRCSGCARSASSPRELIERYDVRGGGPDLPARLLSGGNLQKVVLGTRVRGRAARARRRVADARPRRLGDRDRARVPARAAADGRRRCC